MKLLPLQVAGFRVQISCDDEQIAARLQERYRPFLSGPSRPHFQIGLHFSRRPAAVSALDLDPAFEPGRVLFTAPGFTGEIRLNEGTARLQLGHARCLENSDYFLRVVYALLIFQSGGLLFHAAGIVRRGRAYLFFGRSGSGKTTVSRLSRDCLVLNDDLVAIRPEEDRWIVHSTPFWNPTQVTPAVAQAPLAAMLRLVQSEEVRLAPLSPAQKLAELIASVPIISADPARSARLLTRCQQLIAAAPIYALHFLPDASFWEALSSLPRPVFR